MKPHSMRNDGLKGNREVWHKKKNLTGDMEDILAVIKYPKSRNV